MSEEAFQELYNQNQAELMRFQQQKASCEVSPNTCVKWTKNWTAQDKAEVEAANKDLLSRLHFLAAQRVANLLGRLADKDTFVKLSSPLPGGHSIRFETVYGNSDLVKKLAKEEHIKIDGSVFMIPEHSHSPSINKNRKAAEKRWAKVTEGAPMKVPERVNTEMTPDEKDNTQNLIAQVVRRLAWDARKQIHPFLNDLYAAKTYIKVSGAVERGHIVDYKLVHGSRKTVKSIGQKHKLTVTDGTIEAKGQDVVTSEAEVTDTGFEVDVIDPKTSAPVCVSSQC